MHKGNRSLFNNYSFPQQTETDAHLPAFCPITRSISWTNQPESEEEGKVAVNNGAAPGGLSPLLVVTGGRAKRAEGKLNCSHCKYGFPR